MLKRVSKEIDDKDETTRKKESKTYNFCSELSKS